MAATGSITLTNNSKTVTGDGTSFLSTVAEHGIIVTTVGGTTYSLGIQQINSDTELLLTKEYRGQTTSGQSFDYLPQALLNLITSQLAADTTYAIHAANLDRDNWQQIFSSPEDATVTLPDTSQWSGKSWRYISEYIAGLGNKFEAAVYQKQDPKTFVTGATLQNEYQALATDANFEEYWVWTGSFPKVVSPNTTPTESAGGWQNVGKATVRNLITQSMLAANIKLSTGDTLENYLSYAGGVDPRMPPFNYTDEEDHPDATIEKQTAAVQAAFDFANGPKKYPVRLIGFYRVNYLNIEAGADYSIIGGGGLITFGASSGNAAVDMKNCRNVNWGLGISITNAGTAAYGIRCWGVETEGGTSLNTFSCTLSGFRYNYKFGDENQIDALVSEMSVNNCYTFNARNAIFMVGSQTVISLNEMQALANGTDSVGTNLRTCILMVGGALHVNGGELMQTTDLNGLILDMRPVPSVKYERAFPSVFLNGCSIESAGQWAEIHNPDNVTNLAQGLGGISMRNCHGFYAPDLHCIETSGGFTGKISIDGSNSFHRNSAMTHGIVVATGTSFPVCEVDDSAFDSYFPKGFSKYGGNAVPLFSHRRVCRAFNLQNQTITAGADNTLIWKASAASAAENNLPGLYSATTGKFTVPAGGLKDVFIQMAWNLSGAGVVASNNLSLLVQPSGSSASVFTDAPLLTTGRNQWTFALGNLNAGDVFWLVFTATGTGANWSTLAVERDAINVYARR